MSVYSDRRRKRKERRLARSRNSGGIREVDLSADNRDWFASVSGIETDDPSLMSGSHSTLTTTAVMSSAWVFRQNTKASWIRCSMITLGSSRRCRRTTSIARWAPKKLPSAERASRMPSLISRTRSPDSSIVARSLWKTQSGWSPRGMSVLSRVVLKSPFRSKMYPGTWPALL